MIRWISIGVIAVGIIGLALIVLAYIFPGFREATRDVAIIIMAFFQFISAVLMIAILVAILYTVYKIDSLARNSVVPRINDLSAKVDQLIEISQGVAQNAKDTSDNVRTTAGIVTEQVVAPVIRVSGLVAGARAAGQYLARHVVPRDDDLVPGEPPQ